MRPFRFFFFITVAIILFFAVARVVLIAAFFAAILSITYWGVRSLMNFLGKLSWNEQDTHRGYYGVNRNEDYLNLEEHPMLRKERVYQTPVNNENIIIIK